MWTKRKILLLLAFFETVQLFVDKAISRLEPQLAEKLKGRATQEQKEQRVRGILRLIKPCIKCAKCSLKYFHYALLTNAQSRGKPITVLSEKDSGESIAAFLLQKVVIDVMCYLGYNLGFESTGK